MTISSDTPSINPKAVIGDNQAPDHAQRVTAQMADDYDEWAKSVAALLEEARDQPKDINDDATMLSVAALVKKMRDASTRGEAFRTKEKEPFLRGGNAVDQFFNGLRVKLMREKKTDKAGAADILQARVDDYNQRKLAEERRRREEAERLARAQAEEAARIRREEEDKCIAAEEAAARARKAENVEQLEKVAEVHAVRESEARAHEDVARVAVVDAREATAAKAADMVRTRGDDGALVTMKQEPVVEITDEMKLDPVTLWPFIKTDHKLQALKAWAKITQHKRPMPGAIIEMRDRTVIR